MHGLIVAKEQVSEEILPLLETALYHSYLHVENSDNTVVKHLLHWDIAVKFAKYHRLKLPEQFLKHCARKNLWLEFVLFIQIHQYPIEQVFSFYSFYSNKNGRGTEQHLPKTDDWHRRVCR